MIYLIWCTDTMWNAVQIRPILPYIMGGSSTTPTGDLCPIQLWE